MKQTTIKIIINEDISSHDLLLLVDHLGYVVDDTMIEDYIIFTEDFDNE